MSEELQSIDRALLLALSHHHRDSTPLSLEQERLLDGWIADRLSPVDADRAAELIKRNSFAAERILERRLISAANEGPGVPNTLASRVLRAPRSPSAGRARLLNLQWPTLAGWQWSGFGAAVAATGVIAFFGFQFWQTHLRPDQSFQIAMVTIDDRSVLYEGARTTRGPQAPVSALPAENRYRDIDIPTALLRNAIRSASNHKEGVEHSELINYLRTQSDTFDSRARVLIDSELAKSLSGTLGERNSIVVRVYDLDNQRAANIRTKVKPVPG
jgi:hypothetical protein